MPHVQSVGRLLWPLYMFVVSWIVLPVYATTAARILPLSDADVGRFLAMMVVGVGVMAWWSGIRGGPLLLSEAQVLLGLAGGRSAPTRVAVLRQGLFVGGFLGLAASWLTAMATGGNPELAESARRTLLGVELGVAVVALAILWNVDGRRLWDRAGALGLTGLMVVLSLSRSTPDASVGWIGLVVLAAAGWAVLRAHDVRIDRLWQRSLVLAELQYGAALLDYRSALGSLRSSGDGPRVPRGKRGPGPFPLWLWRPLKSLSGSPALVLARLAAMVAATALSLRVLEDAGAQLAAVAGILAVGAVDLTAPLASVVAQPLLHRGSRVPERLTLLSETLIAISLTVAGGLIAYAFVANRPSIPPLWAVTAVSFAAGASSTIQARLGSPDVGAIIDRFGPERIRGTLAIRSSTPVLLLFLTVGGLAALVRGWNPIVAEFLVLAWVAVLVSVTMPKTET